MGSKHKRDEGKKASGPDLICACPVYTMAARLNSCMLAKKKKKKNLLKQRFIKSSPYLFISGDKPTLSPGMAANVCNSSTWEAKAGGKTLNSRPVWTTMLDLSKNKNKTSPPLLPMSGPAMTNSINWVVQSSLHLKSQIIFLTTPYWMEFHFLCYQIVI